VTVSYHFSPSIKNVGPYQLLPYFLTFLEVQISTRQMDLILFNFQNLPSSRYNYSLFVFTCFQKKFNNFLFFILK
jgi:hypothetical protein